MMAAVVVLFAGVLFWVNRNDRGRLVLGGGVLLAVLLLRPPQAQALGLLSEVSVVLKTINTALGTLIGTINTVQNDVRSVQQVAVWPQTMIQQARSYATNWVNTYQHPMQLLSQYIPASATLAQARSLEQVMTDRNGSNQPQLVSGFQHVFGAVPTDARMSPADKELTDLDDALTVDTLEQVKRGEQVDTTVRAVGDQLETMSTSATPGTAPYLTATALVTMLRSQAATQKMLAAYLRLEGAHLAHRTKELKGSIQAANDLQQTVGRILTTK
jgi:hypothetical protein